MWQLLLRVALPLLLAVPSLAQPPIGQQWLRLQPQQQVQLEPLVQRPRLCKQRRCYSDVVLTSDSFFKLQGCVLGFLILQIVFFIIIIINAFRAKLTDV